MSRAGRERAFLATPGLDVAGATRDVVSRNARSLPPVVLSALSEVEGPALER
ncbi:MAG: hypothetical protein JWR88_115, partial [Pseudonocardia sp.]|nr:hypothetical protein [Pseudonocardia sp.]